jgi:hypothetical protein
VLFNDDFARRVVATRQEHLDVPMEGYALPAFPNRPSRGPRTGKLLSPQPHASCAACPDRATPRQSLLRAAAACGAGGPEVSGGSGGIKCLLNFLSVDTADLQEARALLEELRPL